MLAESLYYQDRQRRINYLHKLRLIKVIITALVQHRPLRHHAHALPLLGWSRKTFGRLSRMLRYFSTVRLCSVTSLVSMLVLPLTVRGSLAVLSKNELLQSTENTMLMPAPEAPVSSPL